MNLKTLLVISVGLSGLSACGDDKAPATIEGDCAAGQTFKAVADPFLDAYCRTCHGALTAEKVGGGHDFSKQDGVLEHGHLMLENLAGGDTPMPPPGSKQPTAAEKQKFVDWLECSGASEGEHEH